MCDDNFNDSDTSSMIGQDTIKMYFRFKIEISNYPVTFYTLQRSVRYY